MFFSQFVQTLARRFQFGGVRFAGQTNRNHDSCTIGLDMALQVCESPAHAYKVIYQHIVGPGNDSAFKFGLSCQPPKPVGPGVRHHIDLNHATVNRPAQNFAELIGKYLRNGIDPLTLESVRADQNGAATRRELLKLKCPGKAEVLATRSPAAWSSPALAALYAACCLTADSLAWISTSGNLCQGVRGGRISSDVRRIFPR